EGERANKPLHRESRVLLTAVGDRRRGYRDWLENDLSLEGAGGPRERCLQQWVVEDRQHRCRRKRTRHRLLRRRTGSRVRGCRQTPAGKNGAERTPKRRTEQSSGSQPVFE